MSVTEQPVVTPDGVAASARRSAPRSAWRALRRSKSAMVGAVLTTVFLLGSLAGAALLLVPSLESKWTDQDLGAAFLPPLSHGHLLGTDALGRDMFARVLVGMSISAAVGVAVTLVSVVVGLALGIVGGYFGGLPDRLVAVTVDVTWSFPVILLAIVFAGIFDPGFMTIFLAVSLLAWAGFARVVRSYVLQLRGTEFVAAARSLGVPTRRIIRTHILPNVITPTLVIASYFIASTMIIEAGVSYLGLGIQPPTPSLGQMIADGRNYLRNDKWLSIVPGTAIALAVLGFNLLGDGLRDILDPRLSKVGR